jgi:hypothetical protein
MGEVKTTTPAAALAVPSNTINVVPNTCNRTRGIETRFAFRATLGTWTIVYTGRSAS